MANKITPNEFFKTPKDFEELFQWIENHLPEDRPYLLMAAMMAWNLACKEVNDE